MLVTPNQISFARILLIPVIFALILYPLPSVTPFEQTYIVGILFTLVSLTDFFDGYLARKYNVQSLMGEILDPLADKMLVTSALVALLAMGQFDAWAVFLILSREFLITGIRAVLASHTISIRSSFIGKTKTVVQMFAIGFSIMGWFGAEILMWSAVAITLYSGGEYLAAALKHIRAIEAQK